MSAKLFQWKSSTTSRERGGQQFSGGRVGLQRKVPPLFRPRNLSNSKPSLSGSRQPHGYDQDPPRNLLGSNETSDPLNPERHFDSIHIYTRDNNGEMSQLTNGSGGSTLEHDVASLRSNKTSSVSLRKKHEFPLYQESASSNGSTGSNQVSFGSKGIRRSSMHNQQTGKFKPQALSSIPSLLRMPTISSRSGSVRSHRNHMMTFPNYKASNMRTMQNLRALPSDVDFDATDQSSKSGFNDLKVSDNQTPTEAAQVSNPSSPRAKAETNIQEELLAIVQKVSKENTETEIKKLSAEVKSAIAEMKKEKNDQVNVIKELTKEVSEKKIALDEKDEEGRKLRDAIIEQAKDAVKQIQAKGAEMVTKISRHTDEKIATLDAATLSNTEKIKQVCNQQVDKFLLQVGQYADECFSKLANSVSQYVPVSWLPFSSRQSLEAPSPPCSASKAGSNRYQESPSRHLKERDTPKSHCRLVPLGDSQEAELPRSVVVSVEKQSRSIPSGAKMHRGETISKRLPVQAHEKENKTPRTRPKKSCVTPNNFQSPVAAFALESTKESPSKPRPNRRNEYIPVEVVVHDSDVASKTSLLGEKSAASTVPDIFRKRRERVAKSRSAKSIKKNEPTKKKRGVKNTSRKRGSTESMPTGGKVKRLRTYATKKPQECDEDSFMFL